MSHNVEIESLSHLTSPEGMGIIVDQKVGPELFVEIEFRIPRSSEKKGRAKGPFVPFFRVGRRVYYRRCVLDRGVDRRPGAAGW
jgi:hypothetical protein